MDLRNVRLTLQRPLRVISSAAHSDVLLDNLQWYDGLLYNTSRSGCCFFVGRYCWNEVSVGHALRRLVRGPATTPGLEGLGLVDLNALLTATLGTFLCECKPLSALVFPKMKGNLIFVMELLRPLAETGLLQYDAWER